MKIQNSTSRYILQCCRLILFILLQWTTLNCVAQQNQYNDIRNIVLLPGGTTTQRPGDATVNADTKAFCSDDRYFYISSSVTGRRVNHDYTAYLWFNLASIPTEAIIDSVDLIIYPGKVKNTSSISEQGVNLYELHAALDNQVINIEDSTSVALTQVSPADINKAVHLRPDIKNGSTWVRVEQMGIYICLLAAEEAETYAYYTERSNELFKQPKLVISYHMPFSQVRRKSWPQYKCDAQHTAMLGWQTNSAVTGFKLKDVFSPQGSNYIKSDPILMDDKLVIAYQASAPPMYRIRTFTQGGLLLSDNTTDTVGLIKYGPVTDRSNLIYSLTGNTGNTLKILRPNQAPALFTKQLENNAQATAVPVIGFDGSIYVSTDKGIYAYSPQPECRLKWTYALSDNKFGTVALNESEQTIFAYDGANGKIVALNSIDGMKKWDSNVESKFTTDIPVPSIRNRRLCVTNNLRNGTSFYILDTDNGNIIRNIKSAAPNNLISQPVIGTDKVYIINNGRLEAYALADGAQQPSPGITGLNPSCTMVMDGNENIYLLNTEQGKQSLTMITPGATSFPSLSISDASGYLTGNRLILAPDGSLFAGNDNHLYSFLPTGFTVKDDITIPFNDDSNFSSEYLYRSEGFIKIAGKEIIDNQNVVIHGGKGIGFKTGFSIKKGATLSCRAGF
ncbi:PQQ-binding-like beta-propeller repeat protein [Chitinophaga sp.]|uniref:outer membrane protein assembly factor BamB family protein n=1 Tax=Chitinophaga sp. TaxID=1869181 RepID=UPI0031CEAEC6